MTTPEAHTSPKPAGSSDKPPAETPRARTYVDFLYFKLDPVYRRRSAEEKRRGAQEFSKAVGEIQKKIEIRTYSCLAWRTDTDFLLWVISKDPEDVQRVMTAVHRTELGAYLNLAYSYLAMTKPTPYSREHVQFFEQGPSPYKYLFVYPFTKTHDWYLLPYEQRKKMMVQHLMVGAEFPNIKVNTTYSFGIGDQDFVLAFDGNDPQEFLDLVQKLRETEARKYTANDMPLLMSVKKTVDQIMSDLALL